METFAIRHLSFSYPTRQNPALRDISVDITQSRFVTICGKSGCGKSTLLRQLKPSLTPHGERSGQILFEGTPLSQLDNRAQAARIGYVLQSPDHQIVTDKVWHELAFGLESLGMDKPSIRLRVAEMASFFGIQAWFDKDVSTLSGGQKQLLNLASIMAMQPSVLILDEPTSQLDPIAAAEFLQTVSKINRELGTTILISEHRLEDVLPLSDQVIVMDDGRIIADGEPGTVARRLQNPVHDMFLAMPTPMRIAAALETGRDHKQEYPLTVREGRLWLDSYLQEQPPQQLQPPLRHPRQCGQSPAIHLQDIWFRYEKNGPDVIKGLSLSVYPGELFAIVGGNGTGKSTALSLISGLRKPYRGNIAINGRKLSQIPDSERFGGLLGILPQNPQALFVQDTVILDLYEIFSGRHIPQKEQDEKVRETVSLCELEPLLQQHPYDLSGGEQQRAALAKVLLLSPSICMLDEPTKGLDSHFKAKLAHILKTLQAKGVTIIMVSHDIAFCAAFADRCAMFFDGSIVTENEPSAFFSGNSFYTTAANRMARHHFPWAVTPEEVIAACGGQIMPPQDFQPPNEQPRPSIQQKNDPGAYLEAGIATKDTVFPEHSAAKDNTLNTSFDRNTPDEQAASSADLLKFSPSRHTAGTRGRAASRSLAAAFIILLCVPLTIWLGIYALGDRKYYAISILVILETMLPFAIAFEGRKPQARELVIIAVLCAIGVAGRMAFFMVPQFKPVVAVVILSGVCFGGETGFLVGAMTGFVSNFFFGQGPWTPWQMFAFGIIGFLAGLLFSKGFMRRNLPGLCFYGGMATFFIYGGIMNPVSVLMYQTEPTIEMFMLAYVSGLPFDIIHAASTVIFLLAIGKPMLRKLERIKIKYGLLEA